MCDGELDDARKRARSLVDSLAGTPEAAEAAYRLVYLNVFYDDPVPDGNRALEDFRDFVASYPEHVLACRAHAWIRVLSVADSLIEHGRDRTHELEERLRSNKEEAAEAAKKREALLDSVRACRTERDSLSTRTQLLEEVIETISKTR